MNARNLSFFILASIALAGLAVVWPDEVAPPPAIVEESGMPFLPDAVLNDRRVLDALSKGDESAMQRALFDAIKALPPDVQADVWAAMFPMRTLPPDAVPDNAAFDMTKAEASAAARLLQAVPPEVLRGQGMDPRFATPEMIQAGSIRDPQARHQALLDALLSLPDDLRKLFAGGFQVYDPEAPVEHPSMPPRMSALEALAALPDEMQAALQDYKHLLSDDPSPLFRAMRSMPPEARKAARRLRALRFPNPGTEKMLADGERRAAAAEAHGYYLKEQRLPLPKMLLLQIRQQRIRGNSGFDRAVSAGPELPDGPSQFQSVAEFEQASGRLAPPMPAHVVSVGTEAFIGPWKDGTARVFADSAFSAPLAIMEYPVDDAVFHGANHRVFGRDAKVVLAKHRDGEWSTKLWAYDGWNMFCAEVATKLEGAQRDAFVRFATDLAENSRMLGAR